MLELHLSHYHMLHNNDNISREIRPRSCSTDSNPTVVHKSSLRPPAPHAQSRIQSPDPIPTHTLPAPTLRLPRARHLRSLLGRLLLRRPRHLALRLRAGDLSRSFSFISPDAEILPRATPPFSLLLRPRAPAGDVCAGFLPRGADGRLSV